MEGDRMKKEEIEEEINEALDRQSGTLMGIQMILATQTRMMAEEHEAKIRLIEEQTRTEQFAREEILSAIKEATTDKIQVKGEGTGADEEHTIQEEL